MKKYLVTLLLFIFPFLISGQSIFEQFQNNKNVTSINITPKMFKMLGSMAISSDDSESKVIKEIINGINSFKALITGSTDIITHMTKWAETISNKEDFEQIVAITERNLEMEIYTKYGQEDGGLKAILIFSKEVSDEQNEDIKYSKKVEAFLLLVEGKISIESISKLISKLNLPGSNQLKKVGI
jgi:hypothetical protein